MVLQASESYYRQQQQIAAATVAGAGMLWRRVGDDFAADWAQVRGPMLELVQRGRLAAAVTSAEYTPAVLAETNQVAPAAGRINVDAFVRFAPDGRDMGTLLDESVVRARVAVRGGASSSLAREQAGAWLTGTLLTVVADTGRAVVGADIAQRPGLGYTRMLNPPSCSRCVVLAGKWFRWNQGFQRHPRCDCRHVPASENVAGDLTTDPYAYFNSLSIEAQEKAFGRLEARAIRDGADIYRVENVRLRGLATAKGNLKYGTPSQMTVDDIYRVAGTRTNAIRLMQQHGYITGPQVAGGNILGNLPTDTRILAAGRGQGTYRVGDQVVTTKRAARYDAVKSGVRDPLNRSTMTAAERRLYDAHTRMEYARQGLRPNTIGANSADRGMVLRPITDAQRSEVEKQYARELAKLRGDALAGVKPAPASVQNLARLLGIL